MQHTAVLSAWCGRQRLVSEPSVGLGDSESGGTGLLQGCDLRRLWHARLISTPRPVTPSPAPSPWCLGTGEHEAGGSPLVQERLRRGCSLTCRPAALPQWGLLSHHWKGT